MQWFGGLAKKKKFDGKRSKYVSSIICRIHFFWGCFFCVAPYKTRHMTFGSKLTTRRDAQQHVKDRPISEVSTTAAIEKFQSEILFKRGIAILIITNSIPLNRWLHPITAHTSEIHSSTGRFVGQCCVHLILSQHGNSTANISRQITL